MAAYRCSDCSDRYFLRDVWVIGAQAERSLGPLALTRYEGLSAGSLRVHYLAIHDVGLAEAGKQAGHAAALVDGAGAGGRAIR